MTRLLGTAALLLAVSACSKSQGLATIEEAEAFAKARGISLAGKTENTKQMMAPRAFEYSAGSSVEITVFQFNSADAAKTYKTSMDDLPFGGETYVQNGHVVMSVYGGGDADRQKVITALQAP